MAGSRMFAVVCIGLVAACASGPPAPPDVTDPILIPELAVPVKRMPLYQGGSTVRLNERMLLMYAGSTPYLLVFRRRCRGLAGNDPITLKPTSGAVDARFDVVYVNNAMCRDPTACASAVACPIDEIYSILEEDADRLRELAGRGGRQRGG